MHGFVTHGGDAPNIVPAHTEGMWMVRAPTVDDLETTRPRVERCFEAGALATGAQLTIADVAPVYSQMEHDQEIVDVYRDNAVALGRALDDEHEVTFSTDMGNVSLGIPSIHPCIAIESARRGQPPARVRRRVRQRVGRPRGARGRAGDGVDRDRHRERPATGAPAAVARATPAGADHDDAVDRRR